MTSLLVLHDLGATEAGRPWREAFDDWPGAVDVPDLPGHGDEPAPVGGHYEPNDVVFFLADRLARTDEAPVVVGVGHCGPPARVLALGGRARALVLVDGLGGPWLDVPARSDAVVALRRRILAGPEALAPHLPGTTDPRAAMVLPATDRDYVVGQLAAVPVPVLAVETGASDAPDAEAVVAEAAAAGGRSDLELARTGEAPSAVAAAVAGWWDAVTTR